MTSGKNNTSRTSRRTARKKTVKSPPSLIQQLGRMSDRLKVAEQELARISAENARLVAENSLLRARLASRAAVDYKS
jgi:regulator of replication initiation timing